MSPETSELALHGGPKAVVTPFGTGNRFQGRELQYLKAALEQNTLFYGFGRFVQKACHAMRRYTGQPYVVACSSGTAALHLGLIACGIGPGDEVVCTPNTDAGTVIGILAEGAVPVFCDVAETLQPTPRTIRAVLTPRTRAVIVVHLAGYPAPVDAIVRLAHTRGIPVLEDCAQSWGTRFGGRMVGTFGIAGAFSTNDFKHISTGDGGFLVLHDEALYRRAANYADKHYDRLFDRSLASAHFGMNYRMTELQGAVALAQLEKVRRVTAHYHRLGSLLERQLARLPAGRLIPRLSGSYATYWWTALLPDYARLEADRDTLVHALQAEGVPASPYGQYDLIHKPLFQTRVMRPWLRGRRRFYPFVLPDGRSYRYDYEHTPVHRRLLNEAIRLSPFGEFATETNILEIAAGILKVFRYYAR
jgi:dTDP-4-amino-4,6-dideoxygalactose transaminase